MSTGILLVDTGTGARRVRLADYLDGSAQEQATTAAHAWIKQLRHARVDGQPLRRQFTLRGDSLWWFAELYLHKRQVVLSLFRTFAALERLAEQERPLDIRFVSGDHVVGHAAREFARARKIRYRGPAGWPVSHLRLARMDLRARALTFAALASRLRSRPAPRLPAGTTVAAFVHRAFWRKGSSEGEAESYIGHVLTALEERLTHDRMAYVGVGPADNFRARRWWHPLRSEAAGPSVLPIESFAPLAALRDSREIWRLRHSYRRMLCRSDDIRRHSVIAGCDCWPVVREELAGIAWLQWPWSARAMDEAGAALDALRPAAALTYAEAGGWGRAIVLEARRRGIRSAGLQHGFIYRHWLNYRHEPDEMQPDPERPEDGGFPRPDLTLLFDNYAARQLEETGRFPSHALAVTGSPRLDALVVEAARLSDEDLTKVRAEAGATAEQSLVTLVTKFTEARQVLPALVAAAAAMPQVQLAIKTHPAETPEMYEAAVGSTRNIRVLPAAAPLAPLVRASRAIVTVNSTVALDAAVLGVPSLVIGLPNNLSPFVDEGVFAGAAGAADVEAAVVRILYDEGFRQQLQRAREAFLDRFAIGSNGGAARRSAEAVLGLVGGSPRPSRNGE
jgi:hypothetical protein